MPKVFFIGAGPGSPDHLTLRGAKVLADCRTVFAFPPYEETFAGLLAGKTVLDPFDYGFEEIVQRVEQLLVTESVAFLIPGDLAFYGPFQGFIDRFGPRAEVTAGVGTANAASACLKRTLGLASACDRVVVTSPRILAKRGGKTGLRDLARPEATLVLFMIDLPLAELVAQLRGGFGKNVPIAIIHRLSLPGEEVVTGTLDDIVAAVGDREFFRAPPGGRSPLTLVIVGETLAGQAEDEWWDQRRESRASC